MTGRRIRIALLAAIALIIPLRAVAAGDAAATLGVSASLNHCGTSSSGIVCRIDVGFNQIPGATSYTAEAELADGSIRSYGAIGAGGGAIWVPYVGAGTYYVHVTAWGTDEQGDEEKIDVDSGAVETDGTVKAPKPKPDPGEQQTAPAAEEPAAEEPAADEPVNEDPAPAEPVPAPTEDPVLSEPPASPTPTQASCPPGTEPDPAAPSKCRTAAPEAAPPTEPQSAPAQEPAPAG